MHSLFLFFLVTLSFAAPRALQASEVLDRRHPDVVGSTCPVNFANLDATIASRRLLEKRVYDKLARMRARYAEFRSMNSADNKAFLKIAAACNRGEPCEAKLFFDIENAVLKELNDKVVQDKDLVTALTNLHKDTLWEMLSADPLLKKHLVGKYSDFKSMRLAFDADTPELHQALRERTALVASRYKTYLDDLAIKQGWQDKGRGLSRDARNWFHSGTGSTPDLAGLSAKCSRSNLGAGGIAVVRSLADCLPQLERAARHADKYQAWVQKRFTGVTGFLTDAGNGKKVLSAEAIEAFKKVTPKGNTAEDFFLALQEAAHDRFQLDISLTEAKALSNYMNRADQFSPGLLQEERIVIDMGQRADGVVSADFKGQNARNLEESLKALAQTEGKPFAERVRAVRVGEEAATAFLEEKKARFQRVLARLVPGLKADFSGDDGIGFVQQAFSPAQKRAFARYWKEEGGEASDLRLTYERFTFSDTLGQIPTEARSALVVEAEGVEKFLRAELIKGVLSRVDLNGLQIVVSMDGKSTRRNTVNLLLVKEGAPLPPSLEGKIRKLLEQKGIPLGSFETSSIR